jgi:hypothetical protein
VDIDDYQPEEKDPEYFGLLIIEIGSLNSGGLIVQNLGRVRLL